MPTVSSKRGPNAARSMSFCQFAITVMPTAPPVKSRVWIELLVMPFRNSSAWRCRMPTATGERRFVPRRSGVYGATPAAYICA